MMLHYGINYQKRLLIYLLAGGFLPLLVVSAVILYAADHMYEAMQEQGGHAEVQRISVEIDHLMLRYQQMIEPLLARDETESFLRGTRTEAEHIYSDLYAALAGRSGEAAIYLISADGHQIIATDDLPRAYHLPENLHWGLIGRAMQEQGWVALAADRYAADQKDTVFSMAYAVRRGGELLGFAVIDM
ncbi:MAG: cache domain-containing protein, partial [Selenomonas sp.]|nr:cache domain-containing protein [Selenomonas sp.]